MLGGQDGDLLEDLRQELGVGRPLLGAGQLAAHLRRGLEPTLVRQFGDQPSESADAQESRISWAFPDPSGVEPETVLEVVFEGPPSVSGDVEDPQASPKVSPYQEKMSVTRVATSQGVGRAATKAA
jgi:hypothetical protein